MNTIEIRKIGITGLEADAIVNAENEGLRARGRVCGAIFLPPGIINSRQRVILGTEDLPYLLDFSLV